MKSNCISFLTAAVLLSTSAVADPNKRSVTSEGLPGERVAPVNSITVVTARQLEAPATASRAIGAQVADNAGEPVGQLHDIDLTGAFQSDDTAPSSGLPQVYLLVAADGMSPDTLLQIPLGLARIEQRQVVVALIREQLLQPGVSDTLVAADTIPAAPVASTDSVATPDRSDSAAVATPLEGLSADTVADIASTADELQRIQAALAQAEETRDFAENIRVFSSADAILVTGQLPGDTERQTVLDVVRRHTERSVRDLMNVGTAAE